MNNKKQSGGWLLLILGLVFLGLAAFVTWSNHQLMFGSKLTNINVLLDEGKVEKHVGEFVEADLDAVLDEFAETTHKVNFIPVGKDKHYLIWMDDDSFMALSIKGRASKEIDRVIDETHDYLSDKTPGLTKDKVHVKGKLVKLSGDLDKYFNEALDYYGVDDSFVVYHVAIDCTDTPLMLIGMAALFALLGIILLVSFIATRKAVREAKYAADYIVDPCASYPTEYGTAGAASTWTEPERAANDAVQSVEDFASETVDAVNETVDAANETIEAAADEAIKTAENVSETINE